MIEQSELNLKYHLKMKGRHQSFAVGGPAKDALPSVCRLCMCLFRVTRSSQALTFISSFL